MRNAINSRIHTILEATKTLPLFTLDDLASMETDKNYLKTLLSRHQKSGSVVRLKKGVYVTKGYIDSVEKTGRMAAYTEFLASALYPPSYVSLETVLHQHGIITELPVVITCVTKNKTFSYSNPLGTYRYHSMRPTLFVGFEDRRDGDYRIARAHLAKALFDYLYFRKQHLSAPTAVGALRLNIDMIDRKQKRELAGYVAVDGSSRMKNILKWLFNHHAV